MGDGLGPAERDGRRRSVESMQESIDSVTEPWGVKVELVQMKNVEIPPTMQRAMPQEAEALREKRAPLIKAEAELDAAEQLRQSAEVIMQTRLVFNCAGR
jgi:regulator of protease activity HflC (stomatin/prohibitin superfamily)